MITNRFTAGPRNLLISVLWVVVSVSSTFGCTSDTEYTGPLHEFFESEASIAPLDEWCAMSRPDDGEIGGMLVLSVICPNVVLGRQNDERVFLNLTTRETIATEFISQQTTIIDIDDEKITYIGGEAIEHYYYQAGRITRLYRGESAEDELVFKANDADMLPDGNMMVGVDADGGHKSFLLNPETLELSVAKPTTMIMNVHGNLVQTDDDIYEYEAGKFGFLAHEYGNFSERMHTVNADLRAALYSCINPPTYWVCELDVDTKEVREFPELLGEQVGYIDDAVIGFDKDDKLIAWIDDQKITIGQNFGSGHLYELDHDHWLVEYKNYRDERFIQWGGIDRLGIE